MKYTEVMELRKPDLTDPALVSDFNSNSDIIDSYISNHIGTLSSLYTSKAELQIVNWTPTINNIGAGEFGSNGKVLKLKLPDGKQICFISGTWMGTKTNNTGESGGQVTISGCPVSASNAINQIDATSKILIAYNPSVSGKLKTGGSSIDGYRIKLTMSGTTIQLKNDGDYYTVINGTGTSMGINFALIVVLSA